MTDVIPQTRFGARVRERLDAERLIWLTTVGKDGTPQPNPVWFIPDGDDVLTYNIPTAFRLRHIADRPRVSLHFHADSGGNDVAVLIGDAVVDHDVLPADKHPVYLRKYADAMSKGFGSPEQFAATYSVPVRARIQRVRGFVPET